MAKSIIIIGGGIMGYCSAYYLSNSGHKITVLEQDNTNSGTSYYNAGMIVPSHFIPLSAPGVIGKALKWILSSNSPFYIKPRLDAQLIAWCWQFFKHANTRHVQRAAPLILDLNNSSRRLYEDIINDLDEKIYFKANGLLMIYNTAQGEKEELITARMAEKLGVEIVTLDNKGLNEIDNGIHYSAKGAVFYPNDAFLDPSEFMRVIEKKLIKIGVEIFKENKVLELIHSNEVIQAVNTPDQTFEGDEFVLACGINSSEIAKKLGLNLPMQGGKGYSITVKDLDALPRICSILTEAKVAVTPIGNSLRLAGTMEISGTDLSVNRKRAKGYLKAIERYMPSIKYNLLQNESIWAGLRPCTPDGLPYLGRMKKFPNLIVATGHAMMGMSLGPITGNIVSSIVDDFRSQIDISLLDPNRYN